MSSHLTVIGVAMLMQLAGLSAALGAFLAGVLLFSGSIFGLVLLEQRWLGPLTPIGGVCLIAGWASLFWLARAGASEEARVSVDLADIVDGHDVRMAQAGGGHRAADGGFRACGPERTDLARFEAEASRLVPRRAGPDERYDGLAPDLLDGVRPTDLLRAFLKATAPRPVTRVETHHIAPIRVSVADAVAELSGELPALGRVTFRRLTGDLVDRIEVVVRFLAVLELFKQGLVDLDVQIGRHQVHVADLGVLEKVVEQILQALALALHRADPLEGPPLRGSLGLFQVFGQQFHIEANRREGILDLMGQGTRQPRDLGVLIHQALDGLGSFFIANG